MSHTHLIAIIPKTMEHVLKMKNDEEGESEHTGMCVLPTMLVEANIKAGQGSRAVPKGAAWDTALKYRKLS